MLNRTGVKWTLASGIWVTLWGSKLWFVLKMLNEHSYFHLYLTSFFVLFIILIWCETTSLRSCDTFLTWVSLLFCLCTYVWRPIVTSWCTFPHSPVEVFLFSFFESCLLYWHRKEVLLQSEAVGTKCAFKIWYFFCLSSCCWRFPEHWMQTKSSNIKPELNSTAVVCGSHGMSSS